MNTKFMQFLFNSAECAINLNKWLANISYQYLILGVDLSIFPYAEIQNYIRSGEQFCFIYIYYFVGRNFVFSYVTQTCPRYF